VTTAALKIALADLAMVTLAVGAVHYAIRERRPQPIGRWHLLLPGLLAALSDTVLIAYPQYRDLFQLELWTVNTAALAAGLARGALLSMFSDHNLKVVRVRRTWDAVVVAALLLGFALLQTFIELRAFAENRDEAVMEFFMTVAAGYLFGRSVAAWIRAMVIQHDDLDRPM
jgi:hypothetical protein